MYEKSASETATAESLGRASSLKHVLFVRSQNGLRSPTAEQIFSSHPGIACLSAGLNNEAQNPVTPELVEWAEIIFIMEPALVQLLKAKATPFLPAAPFQ